MCLCVSLRECNPYFFLGYVGLSSETDRVRLFLPAFDVHRQQFTSTFITGDGYSGIKPLQSEMPFKKIVCSLNMAVTLGQ